MNKKHILLIIFCFIIIFSVSFVLYTIVKNNEKDSIHQAIFEIVCSYVKTDKQFEEQYGACVSVSKYDNNKIKHTNEKIYTVPCIVTVDSGKNYLVWVDFDYSGEIDKFTYASVSEVS